MRIKLPHPEWKSFACQLILPFATVHPKIINLYTKNLNFFLIVLVDASLMCVQVDVYSAHQLASKRMLIGEVWTQICSNASKRTLISTSWRRYFYGHQPSELGIVLRLSGRLFISTCQMAWTIEFAWLHSATKHLISSSNKLVDSSVTGVRIDMRFSSCFPPPKGSFGALIIRIRVNSGASEEKSLKPTGSGHPKKT